MATGINITGQNPTISDNIIKILCDWGPTAVITCVAGYYGLGIAYDLGVMARIDQIAIPILKNWFGYAGLGAIMPTFQWYAAWAVRLCCGAIAGFICKVMQMALVYIWGLMQRNMPYFFGHPADNSNPVESAV